MADEAATLQILVDIRARLDAIAQVQSGMRGIAEDTRRAHEEGSSLGALFARGLGIGSGMEMARRAVDLFRDSFTEAIGQSSQLAAEIERAHGRLGLAGEDYQTLAAEARAAGTDFQEMTSSMAQYRQLLGNTLLDPSQGVVLRQLGLDAQELASVPLPQQMERTAVALGRVTDGNVRARLTQELFGRSAAAMQPLLERLRTEGYDKLKSSAEETNAILGDGMAEALSSADRSMEEARTRLGVALAPLNLQLIQAKTQLANLLAKNSGVIQSGVEASLAGALVANVEKGLERIEKSGGLEKAFQNWGKVLAGPFGVGFVTAVGGFIIKEIERRALEADQRSQAFDESSHGKVRDYRTEISGVSSQGELLATQQRIRESAFAARQELAGLEQEIAPDDEQLERMRSLRQEIDGLNALLAIRRERLDAIIAKNREAKDAQAALVEADYDLLKMEISLKEIEGRNDLTNAEKRSLKIDALSVQIDAYKVKIDAATEKLKKLGQTADQIAHDPELMKLIGARDQTVIARDNLAFPVSQRRQVRDRYESYSRGENDDGSKRLGVGEGFSAGAMEWVSSLGSAGEQVAGALQSTIGATVQGISDGIWGWITGTESFGDVLLNLGGTILQTMLQTIIQMGVQWLINAALIKLGMISIEATGDTLRTARVAKENAAEAATLPAKTAGAAASGISSWGVALVFGALAVAMIMGLLGGFATGGYTGPGGQYEPAGIVHRGEVVFSQSDVARSGGVGAVEAARLGGIPTVSELAPAPAQISARPSAAPLDAGAAIAAAVAAGVSAKPDRPHRTVVVDQRRIADQMAQEPGVTTFIQDIVTRMLPT